jgi:type I restriction enzyme M protein
MKNENKIMSNQLSRLLNIGINKNYFSISLDSKRITYTYQGKSYKFSDPEELVRAEYYVELIEKYQYRQSRIDFEIVVPRRTPSDIADIVIYEDDEKLKPFIVIECKRDGISDSEFEQAIEQAFGNANSIRSPFNGTVAGNTRRFFDVKNSAPNERTKNIIADIPINYGKVQEYRFRKGDENWDIKPVEKEELIRLLEKCHNTLWDGGKMQPTEAFDELSKIIFVKVRDEQTARRKGDPYDFQIKSHETPDGVHKRIIAIYDEAKKDDPDVFSENILSVPSKLFTVVNHLQGVDLSRTDLDTKGVAFERFMEDFFKGKQGQYFTPREIVNFIVQSCELTNRTKVIDPSCGSGGFLLYALDYIRQQAGEYYDVGTDHHFKYWHDFAANNLYGIEVNERIARVAKMNMIIHDDGHTNVICSDALEQHSKIQAINQKFKKNEFDLIITNPPFGASVKKEEKPYLSSFTLGKDNKDKTRKTQKTEVLFIERCWEYLKAGTGKIAIIIPDGILTNTTLKYVRDFMVSKFQIEAIISLPQVTFAHYGAGLKSTILLMRKLGENEKLSDYDVFCAIANEVGYDSTGRKSKTDLPDILSRFNDFKNGVNCYTNMTYVKKLSQLNNNRLDAYYYSPMFEDILKEIRKSKHPLKRLADVCVSNGISTGKTPAKDDYSESPSDPKIVKVAALKSGKVNFDLVEFVNPDCIATRLVNEGDILILGAAHQAEYLGKNPCIVEIPQHLKDEEISFVGELVNVRADVSKVNPYYLLQLFNTRNYFLLINREKRGQTSHLYPKDLLNLLIPVPLDIDGLNENALRYKKNYSKYEDYVKKANDILNQCYLEFEKEYLN